MQGYKIVKIIEGGVSKDGDFVAVCDISDGERRGLVLGTEQLDDLSRLLQAAVASQKGQLLSFVIPEQLEGEQTVANVESEATWPGTFTCRFEAEGGKFINVTMPHEAAVRWRDELTRHIDEFIRTRAN